MSTVGIISNFTDVDLTPPNVKNGVDIFGVIGTLVGAGSIGSFDDTVTHFIQMMATCDGYGDIRGLGATVYEGVNNLYLISAAAGVPATAFTNRILSFGVLVTNKTTGKIKTHSGAIALVSGTSMTLDNSIGIDDSIGAIRFQTSTGTPSTHHVYYNSALNVVNTTAIGTYTPVPYTYYENPVNSTGTGSAATYSNMCSIVYGGKTYTLQVNKPYQGSSESFLTTRIQVS